MTMPGGIESHGAVGGARRLLEPIPDDVTALVRRLDSVDEELFTAEKVLGDLVRYLEPVLPVGFGQETRPVTPAEPPSGPSPLAARLSDLARRSHDVVRQLQTIAAAVDL